MAFFSDNFETMRNKVLMVKPNLGAELAGQFLNQVMRMVLDSRQWSDSLKRKIYYVPAEYTTGTVTLTQDSDLVTGSGTSWPINDLVDTTVPVAITQPGVVSIQPASMDNIEAGMLLLADRAVDPEVVAVRSVTSRSIEVEFTKTHGINFTLECSTFVGRQLSTGNYNPFYTIISVRSATELQIEEPWQASTSSGTTYSIRKIRSSLGANITDVLYGLDRVNGLPLPVNHEQGYIDMIDPQRTSTGDPVMICVSPKDSHSGDMQWELWPTPVVEKQIEMLVVYQWPDMKNKGDRPPPFINPDVIVAGAQAKAKLNKNPSARYGGNDPFYDPNAAAQLMAEFQAGLEMAATKDEERALKAREQIHRRYLSYGDTEFAQSHDLDAFYGKW